MQKVKFYKCPHCGEKYQSLQTWGNHVAAKHPGMIPEGWSYGRYFYMIQTGKKVGACVMCKNPTEWNETSLKYDRFCGNPDCKKQYREMFIGRMITTHGKVHLLNDPEQQRKMVAARRISGMYTFADGTKVGYVGSYEKDFLMFLDRFLHINGTDIMMPSPHTYEYKYKNENDREHEGVHFYIPDAYIPTLNLEVEIKQDSNMNPKMIRIDKVKELQKDDMMRGRSDVNYIKIVEKRYAPFIEFVENYQQRDVAVTESAKYPDFDYVMESKMNKEYLKLSDCKMITLTPTVVKAYKKECSDLSKIWSNGKLSGEIALHDGKVAGYYVLMHKDNTVWLRILRVTKKCRGKHLSSQLLNRAIRKGGLTNITVPTDDVRAIHVYKSFGFKEYFHNDKNMLFCLNKT